MSPTSQQHRYRSCVHRGASARSGRVLCRITRTGSRGSDCPTPRSGRCLSAEGKGTRVPPVTSEGSDGDTSCGFTDAELRRGVDLAFEVETAFEGRALPDDDAIVKNHGQYWADDVAAAFRGKHWRDVSPALVSEYRYSLQFFTPAALCFYLPAFIILSLTWPGATLDMAWEGLFTILTPPIDPGDSEFDRRFASLSPPQRRTVSRFVEHYVAIEASNPQDGRERTIAYWCGSPNK